MSPLLATLRHAKRLLILIAGMSILIAGFAMIVLPGPAIVVIPVGLGVLATEFVWARKLLQEIRNRLLRRAGSGDVE